MTRIYRSSDAKHFARIHMGLQRGCMGRMAFQGLWASNSEVGPEPRTYALSGHVYYSLNSLKGVVQGII